jgi:hypothetical protein
MPLIMISLYKVFFADTALIKATLVAIIMLVCSLICNFYASSYADRSESNSVTDIVLSNTTVWDVDGIFIYGAIVFYAFVLMRCVRYPHQIPYIIKSIALFIVIRSIFISLTHISPFPSVPLDNGILSEINFGADLFFSGHTGLPFLMALIFWDHKRIRLTFIVLAIFFGVVVLLGHIHYSIDVLAAFFITYGIHHIAERLWAPDIIHFRSYHSIIYPKNSCASSSLKIIYKSPLI